jgi:hypothetical protein
VTDLDTRYGRSHRASRRVRATAIGAAIAFALVFAAWLWWAGLLAPAAEIGVEVIGYHVDADDRITVRYQVTVDPGTAVQCAVQALDTDFATVGWKVVDIPAAEMHSRRLESVVNTTHRAVSGLIYRCWRA